MLQAFKNDAGLDDIKGVLEIFYEEVKSSNNPVDKHADMSDRTARLTSAYSGIKIILGFFAQITMSKSITESNQTHAISSSERDKGQPTYFSPAQFLVELRMTILPIVKAMWDSDFVDKASGSIIKHLIEILRTVLEGGDEQGAFKRGDSWPPSKKIPLKVYNIHSDKVRYLTDQGYDHDIAQEALYRCLNTQNLAVEYCQALNNFPGVLRYPIPDYDQEKPRRSATQTPQRSESGATVPESDRAAQPGTPGVLPALDSDLVSAMLYRAAYGAAQTDPSQTSPGELPGSEAPAHADANVETEVADRELSGPNSTTPPPAPGIPIEAEGDIGNGMAMSIDNLRNILSSIPGGSQMRRGTRVPLIHDYQAPSESTTNALESPKASAPVAVEDLDDKRSTVRENLIDRALDVLNVHDDVTFELAELINAATVKATDAKQLRSEIGETLVQSLISLQSEDDFRPAGKRIASYANLLALVLQEKDFYEATTDVLIENLGQLLGFIRVFSDQPPDEARPWIGQILLVIEKVLAEDVQPSQIQWTPPTDGRLPEDPIADIEPPLVSEEAKNQLFEAIVKLLSHVGKDESLALSVVRILVILTRNREIASRLAEKRNIQLLFIMVKQLSGMTNDRLPSTFMLLLRHIIEDDDTIRQIMRSEVLARFENRPGRPTDLTTYTKQMHDLIIRAPRIFIEVTNEKFEIVRFDPTQRPQTLALKPEVAEIKSTAEATTNPASPEETSAAGSSGHDVDEAKPAAGSDESPGKPKVKATESKAPVVEHPSGVIHFLLYELLTYKDAKDTDDPLAETSPSALESADALKGTLGSSATPAIPTAPANLNSTGIKKAAEKPEFKAQQHPIYIYRCFLLQCLTELLHSYNRTKIEFINFSRKADPKAMTPSKPRSGVLNYLLNDLIPVGTLAHEETIAYRKKNSTSNWAMSAIVSLCLRTNENGHRMKRYTVDEDDEVDLLFVRKFVLEHALKAYKDANVSEEHPDIKYARLLDLADLFNRLLLGKLIPPTGAPTPGTEGGPQKSIAKLMFEKNFISALTTSIADVDLNFPGSKRAIKYILRPLRQLTQTAIALSESSSISTTPGHTDEDEISTASSVSDVDDERDATPDLYRNSTLGMFEAGREEESSSGSSEEDEEMYDDEYDEGMDYEDEMGRDVDEVISDEDEDLGEAGPIEGLHGEVGMDVEVVIDGEDDEPSDDDDDQDDSEDMDAEEEVEVIDEITGDNENDSLAEGDDEDWQDEDGEGIARYDDEVFSREPSQDQDPESAVRDIVREFGGAEAALHRLEGLENRLDVLEDGSPELTMEIDGGRYMDDVVGHEHDDEGEKCNRNGQNANMLMLSR